MNIGRKRIVLVEKILPSKHHKQIIPEVFRPLLTPISPNAEMFLKNRFSVELERIDGLKIDESRICGFKIENNGNKKIFKVKTFLHIKEWITDYEKVIIARIFLNDSTGNEINTFDLDVHFEGYSIECDYTSDGRMTPYFFYSIMGD